MYKKAVLGIVMLDMLFMISFMCVRGFDLTGSSLYQQVSKMELDEAITADKTVNAVGIADIAVSGQRIVNYNMLVKADNGTENVYILSEEDIDILCRIVEAEAGSEDEDGRLLVANVVLNRMQNENFPDTVKGVVFQSDNGVVQFSPVANGRFFSVTISDETINAVQRALTGEDISDGALYFVAREYADTGKLNWFDSKLTYLFQHGGHEFYTSYK
jgi:N-acetylmuramoyl-L-alanine amidase